MRVLVCGGRDFDDRITVYEGLLKVAKAYGITEIIEGGARGADQLAGEFAIDNGIKHTRVLADWQTHGKAAGHIRNQAMLDLNPDLVVAFPGGRGTANMVSIAKAKGTRVIQLP